MSKTGTVTKAEYTGKTWERDGKTFYIHAIEFSNGEGGEYLSADQNQTKFVQGQEAEYDRVPKDGYPDKIKPAQSNTGYGGGGGKKYNEKDKYPSFSMSYSKDLACAGVITPEQMFPTADKILDWLNSKA